MTKVLVVEDDRAILRGLADSLKFEGYDVLTAVDGKAGYLIQQSYKPDLIILDLMMPKINGLELCRKFRAEGVQTPILMLTAKGQEADRITGLDMGADDYMTKPFSVPELLARVRAIIRRAQYQPGLPDQLRFGEVVVDFRRFEVRQKRKVIEMTPKEFAILRLLASREGQVVTRDELLNEVWGLETYPESRTVDYHVAGLRAKLEADPAHPKHIRTVHGVGYKFIKALCVVLMLLVAMTIASAQNAPDLYQQALTQERAVGDLKQAIQLFERALKDSAGDRPLAAKALLGAARCYEKLGLQQASESYEEVAQKYSDQREQAAVARERLAALAGAAANFNFEAGVLGHAPWGWVYSATATGSGNGANIVVSSQGCVEGQRCALMTGSSSPAGGWLANLSKTADARPYVGREVRFNAAVRVEGADTTAQIWFRFDRVSGDSLRVEKPIYPGEWNDYSIIGNVAADTVKISFGVMFHGSGRVWVDDTSFGLASENNLQSRKLP